ncbi:MAG: hypothetical protein K2X55_15180 [Burkholderiaceae bacterium]|nr:hypothetical protein [Burkholderiaceae bacterium]
MDFTPNNDVEDNPAASHRRQRRCAKEPMSVDAPIKQYTNEAARRAC